MADTYSKKILNTNMDNPLLKMRRTKIVATIGPSSGDEIVIERLIRAGANVFRLNMSHGSHDEHGRVFSVIRSVSDRIGIPVAVVADLCGPKIRVGTFRDGAISLKDGQDVTVTVRDVVGDEGLIPSRYAELAADVKRGDTILLDDGMIEISVLSVSGTEIYCRVVHGGLLKDKKGMNLPGVSVSAPSLTQKDKADAVFAMGLCVDFLALSFVRKASDVAELKAMISEAGHSIGVIAKIEKPEALECLDEILGIADGVMVARGDLGVEVPPEKVPIIQQDIVTRARAKYRPVIIATQMLESMIEHPRPTRAEVSDVSNAVFSGADAVMLSGETASGRYPVEAVEVMDHVARQVEAWQWANGAFSTLSNAGTSLPVPPGIAIARGAAQLSRDLQVRTLVVPTRTGATPSVVSGARPAAPIIGLATSAETCRRLCLIWGVIPMLSLGPQADYQAAREIAKGLGLADKGQYILLIAGFKPIDSESEPSITVLQV